MKVNFAGKAVRRYNNFYTIYNFNKMILNHFNLNKNN